MSVQIVEEVKGGAGVEYTFPSCPKCGTKGVFLHQTYDTVDGFFSIVDVYACPVCQPEVIAAQQSMHADAGDSAASQAVTNASAETTSQNETTPAQRGLRKPLEGYRA